MYWMEPRAGQECDFVVEPVYIPLKLYALLRGPYQFLSMGIGV